MYFRVGHLPCKWLAQVRLDSQHLIESSEHCQEYRPRSKLWADRCDPNQNEIIMCCMKYYWNQEFVPYVSPLPTVILYIIHQIHCWVKNYNFLNHIIHHWYLVSTFGKKKTKNLLCKLFHFSQIFHLIEWH